MVKECRGFPMGNILYLKVGVPLAKGNATVQSCLLSARSNPPRFAYRLSGLGSTTGLLRDIAQAPSRGTS